MGLKNNVDLGLRLLWEASAAIIEAGVIES